MDIFTWSIPFVAEKITEMLYHVIKPSDEEEKSNEEVPDMPKIPV